MPIEFAFAMPVALPAQSGIARVYSSMNLADAFAIRLPLGATSDPDLLARFIFANQPHWIGRLTRVQDLVVAGFGLKTAKQLATLAADAKSSRLGIFKVDSKNETEIVLGEHDKHLDFRVSVLCSDEPASENRRQLIVSTVVHRHNLLGRVYILVVAPIHRMVVKASLRRAATIGWPRAIL